MEKRKAIGLKGYFTRTLLLFFIGIVAIFVSAIAVLFLCMQAGILTPANVGETAARAEMARQREIGTFTGDLDPEFYDYIYFDKEGDVQASSLAGNALSREIERYSLESGTFGTGVYVFYEDGSYGRFTWNYAVRFTNPTLQNILPNAEMANLVLAGAISIVFFLLFVRGMGRKLGNKLALIETASEQIARQKLDTPIATNAGIKEFDHALQSMDDMRSALKDALIKQWESEQQRKQEIAALAHDIKTPLTIINGNAELLLEDSLVEGQAELVNSIRSAGLRAQQYLGALQQVTNMELANETMEPVVIKKMLDELNAVLAPLAQDKSIELKYIHGERPNDIQASVTMLTRALINIGENAIKHTNNGGKVTITVLQNKQETIFIVQDEGAGFSKTALKHAKEMFWQQDNSRTGSSNYGIGLSIAEKVAQKHTGRLVLENTSQGGCVKLIIRNTCNNCEH